MSVFLKELQNSATPPGDIEPPSELGGSMDTRCILGVTRHGDVLTTLLNIDRVLTSEAIKHLQPGAPMLKNRPDPDSREGVFPRAIR